MRGWSQVTTEINQILDGSPLEQPDADMQRSVPESRRPALVRLSLDVEELVSDMETGFQSREEVLRWARRMIPRTLGEIPTEFYRELSKQFGGVIDDDRERTLLAALLVDRERTLEMDTEAVDQLRQRLAVHIIEPAYRRAFRALRNSATEYVDDGDSSSDSEHDPARQRYIAMRPVMDELDQYQRVGVDCLLAGLEDRDGIRRWGTVLELATHGELPEGFVRRCTEEQSTRTLLTAENPSLGQQRARELFAATFLLPAYNRGVRDLRDRAKEEANAERQETEVASL